MSHIEPDVPDALIGDAGRLRQVLLNLVGNAIKFTEHGEIVVSVVNQAIADESVVLQFSVKDTGIGIAPHKQQAIFRAFEQEDNSTTRKYGGTGLGLSISDQLVELMGGTITVESQPGRGSTFTFTARLTRRPHSSDARAVSPPPTLGGLPVLIVDDNATNRHILGGWLRNWAMEPVEVGDGMMAMDALWRGLAEGRPYPLALLDARMPDTDGFAVAAMIRDRAQLAGTRIIMLTSGDRPGDAAKVRALRIDAHLLKPARQEELLASIFRVMSSRGSSEPASLSPVPSPATTPTRIGAGASLNIWVAEDNELSAQVLEQLLRREGHRVRVVSNGRDALAMAEEKGFDLALMDVQMPRSTVFRSYGRSGTVSSAKAATCRLSP